MSEGRWNKAGAVAGWIGFLTFVSNFTLGTLIPLLPIMGEKTAGVAFSSFALFKVLFLFPAGRLSDRFGAERSMTAALFLQVLALVLMRARPDYAWIARIFEGIALSQGIVSSLGMLRSACPTPGAFAQAIRTVMAVGGAGLLFGPLFGFWLIRFGAPAALVTLIALNAVTFALQCTRLKLAGQGSFSLSERVTILEEHPPIYLIAGLSASKILAQAWQPLIAWWATSVLGLSFLGSGLCFIVMGLAYTFGAWRLRVTPPAWMSVLGMVLIELSVQRLFGVQLSPLVFQAALALLGFWYGVYMSLALARLGWNEPERAGRINARWLFATDLPVALFPALLWEIRAPEAWLPRSGLVVVLVAVSAWGFYRARVGDGAAV